MSLLDAAGVGVRHCLGVGGRDLSAAVGGASARQALRMLDADPGTELILVVSKPPAPQVAAELEALAATLDTPVRFALLGPGQPDLTAAARGVVEALGQEWTPPRSWAGRRPTRTGSPPAAGRLRRRDAVRRGHGDRLRRRSGPIASNIPLDGAPRACRPVTSVAAEGHADDRLRGRRVHPRPPAPDDRQLAAAALARRRGPRGGVRATGRCSSTSSSGTARTPTPPPSWPRRSVPPGRRPGSARRRRRPGRHRGRPAGPAPPGRAPCARPARTCTCPTRTPRAPPPTSSPGPSRRAR